MRNKYFWNERGGKRKRGREEGRGGEEEARETDSQRGRQTDS